MKNLDFTIFFENFVKFSIFMYFLAFLTFYTFVIEIYVSREECLKK